MRYFISPFSGLEMELSTIEEAMTIALDMIQNPRKYVNKVEQILAIRSYRKNPGMLIDYRYSSLEEMYQDIDKLPPAYQ